MAAVTAEAEATATETAGALAAAAEGRGTRWWSGGRGGSVVRGGSVGWRAVNLRTMEVRLFTAWGSVGMGPFGMGPTVGV
jgi:hypothetical protein